MPPKEMRAEDGEEESSGAESSNEKEDEESDDEEDSASSGEDDVEETEAESSSEGDDESSGSEEDGTDEDGAESEASEGKPDVAPLAAAGASLAQVGNSKASKDPNPESSDDSSDLSDESRRIKQKKRAARAAGKDDDDFVEMELAKDKKDLAIGLDPNLKAALAETLANARGAKQAEKQKSMEDMFGSVFDTLDADKGGTLDVDGELLQTMQKLGLEVLLKDLRIAMERVVQRKHQRVERVGMFQKRLVWDYMFKEEFIKVMVLMSEPEEIDKQKQAEEELFKVFQEFDVDRSGSIDSEELGQAMAKMGRPMTEDQVDNLLMQIDTEGTGAVNFVDFASIFGIRATPVDYEAAERAETLNQLAEARATFKTFDFDNSDSIDMNELDAIMKAMGKKMSEAQLQRMMASVDTDGSGEIDFKEFCQLLGVPWDDQAGVDLKEIDAFSKANRPKDQKKKASVHQEDGAQMVVQPIDENAPYGLTVHSGPAGFKFVRFSPNGHFLGICCNDGSVKVYEMKANGKSRRMCSMREHTHHVLCLAWSPQSDRLVSVAADRMLHMWHVKTGACVQSAKAHSAYVRCVDWSRDGTMIATCSSDKTVKLFNPITLEQSKLLLGHSNWVRFVKFRADSKRLVSGGDDNFIIIWSVPEGQIVQRMSGFKSSIADVCFLNMEQSNSQNYRLPPLVTGCLNGDVSIWHPDVGLHGFMHYTLVGIENMYPSVEGMRRYIIFEIGRNRHHLKTRLFIQKHVHNRPVVADSFDYEADTDKVISCSVWDMNEVVRLQLFEVREGEHVRLMGEFKSTHQELRSNFADGIQQRFNLYSPDEDKLTDGGEFMTFLRMKIRFEPMDHNANLNISVEEGKNMKHPEIKGPISTRVTVRTQRGQEYTTGVVINSKTPQWSQVFNFGIGSATHEIDVSVDMVDPVERFAEELGSFQLRMDKLLSKVCSQQEPLSGWYVVRNELDRKSRGSIRLKFTWTEAVKEKEKAEGKYLSFPVKLSGVRGEIGTFFTPRHKITVIQRTLWESTCRFCRQHAKQHTVEGRCPNTAESTGKQIVCMAQSSDGVLLAWGTEVGNIFIVNTDTGDQLAQWRAHYHAVEGLAFSPDNTVLTSCGVDIRPSIPMEEYMLLTSEQQEAMPRRCSVVKWDLERWMMQRMKSRIEY